MADKFPFYKQLDSMDCGATCLRMISKFYGRYYSLEYLRDLVKVEKDGVSISDISDGAERIGFHTLAVKVNFDRLQEDIPLPCIAHWDSNHYVVIYKVTAKSVTIADPALGKRVLSRDEFRENWINDRVENQGVLLLFEATPDFYQREGEKVDRKNFSFLFSYIGRYKKLVFQLILGIVIASILQLIFPFLTQSLVDIGINNRDLKFIYLILIAQLVLFVSQTLVEYIRSWILMHIGTRVNISLVSDFLQRMMKLPMRFFDSRLTGDLLQRIEDNQRVENFLTVNSFSTFFSIINLFIFSFVLAFFNLSIFFIFIFCTILYVLWIVFFLKKRKELDYKRFDILSKNMSNMIEIINGMPDIKMHNAERQKRWNWERNQASLFRTNVNYLAQDQYQHAGANFINELKNIIITFVAAKSVLDGQLSIGQMVAIQYIIGHLNGPLEQLVGFIRSAQDAKISLERLSEIHQNVDNRYKEQMVYTMPSDRSIYVQNLSFRYGGINSPMVLNNINITIPERKKVAIVGTSGSGKTTLVKLLLGMYKPTEGNINIGDTNLEVLEEKTWRTACGVVLQDGYIFSESIAKNIALGDEIINKDKLYLAARIANIDKMIDAMPAGYNTIVGSDGVGLSDGQKQRILIARSAYKNPLYLFFDEATNALDSNNEIQILKNMDQHFHDTTMVIVAHRLSTVKNADLIIVLEKGEIIEQGTHQELISNQKMYYNLIKEQLALGM
jgi:ATP-binding cassette, subfamily B, bacterial